MLTTDYGVPFDVTFAALLLLVQALSALLSAVVDVGICANCWQECEG